jgi:transposase
MSHHIRGHGRSQVTLFPETLDEFVCEEDPVRVIDAFVDALDVVNLGFKRAIPEVTGRPGYATQTLRLWLPESASILTQTGA